MVVDEAPGFAGDWLNGWLAAIGVTVLLDDVRLSWTGGPSPIARFHHDGTSPVAARILAALPDVDWFTQRPFAAARRKVDLDTFQAAAAKSREERDDHLAPFVTDLLADSGTEKARLLDLGDLRHGPLDPPAPKGTTIIDRAAACRRALGDASEARILETLRGIAARSQMNGLGFDIRRLAVGSQPDAKVMVDVVIECLCFVAARVFPFRGDGRRTRLRGWEGPPRRGAFVWPVWSEPLDAWAVDALVDVFSADRKAAQARYSVCGGFALVPFEPSGKSDTTRGYASEPADLR